MPKRAYSCVGPLAVGLFVGALGIQVPELHVPVLDFAYFRDLAIAFACFIGGGLGLPIPEEVLIVYYGIWTATHAQYGLFRWLILPVSLLGVLIADCLLYSIGRYFGRRIQEYRWTRWMLPPGKRDRIEKNFHDYGVGILLFGRLLPGVRAPLFLTAGVLRLPVPRFVLADALGAIVGNSILYFLAFWFGDSLNEFLHRVKVDVDKSRPLMIMIAIAAVGVYLLIHFWRKPVTEGDPNELPIIGRTIADHMSGDDRVSKREVPTLPKRSVAPSPNGEPAAEKQRKIRVRKEGLGCHVRSRVCGSYDVVTKRLVRIPVLTSRPRPEGKPEPPLAPGRRKRQRPLFISRPCAALPATAPPAR